MSNSKLMLARLEAMVRSERAGHREPHEQEDQRGQHGVADNIPTDARQTQAARATMAKARSRH